MIVSAQIVANNPDSVRKSTSAQTPWRRLHINLGLRWTGGLAKSKIPGKLPSLVRSGLDLSEKRLVC